MASGSGSDNVIPLAAACEMNEAKRTPIPDPPYDVEKRAIWKSQVFIHISVNGNLRAILGPLKKAKKGRPNSLPEGYEHFHPSIRGDELILAFQPSYRFPFLKDPKRTFRSAPPNPSAGEGAYLRWLDRVEASKSGHWKVTGIFDLIQLSRSPITYNPAMLLSSLFFWERSTNSFHVPFGMLSPTLLDVAAITGLWVVGDDYHSSVAPTNPIAIPTDNIAFSKFIKDHYVENGEVSDAEHVAFLLYWLSAYVFCTKSLRIPAKLLPLANLLHEGRIIAMARLVLGNLYQMINEAIADIRDPKVASLNAAGPFWLLQLWMNAVFEPSLPAKNPPPTVSNTRIDAFRLEALTPPYDASTFEFDFKKYFTLFFELKRFRSSFAPYHKPSYGPRWLRNSYPNLPGSENLSQHQVELWQTILSPRVLTINFASNDFTLCGYNPQLVSRQFGLSQDLPNTLFDKSLILYPGTITKRSVFDTTISYYNEEELLGLSPFSFTPSFYVTQAFKAWWSAYWHDISTPIEDCFQRITNIFLLQRQAPKKTKAEPIPRPTPHASPRVASAIVEVEDDDDDDDVALADKLKIPKSRKRGATPTTSASQKRAKGAGEPSAGNPSPAKSASQREEVQQGGEQGVDEQASNPLLQGTTPIPVEMAQAKKTSGKRSSRKSGSSSSHHSKSSTSSSPLKASGPKDM
ncbi:uncharacterized protein LOC130748161 isoform X2 [Lotus japonicus]|uniref:uncharacterized protein LOC130748161 isoform X2 n=1 Tax=Lotus japonicus TaxID=34305 RepID=UPI00258EC941|nr:uncharacterized protein LOC130748161 isoform X2 [Lotus japonicus]